MTKQSITTFLSGKKSYLCVAAYFVYQFGLSKAWWVPNHTFEVSLVGGFGASMRHAIQKAADGVASNATEAVTTAPAPSSVTINLPPVK